MRVTVKITQQDHLETLRLVSGYRGRTNKIDGLDLYTLSLMALGKPVDLTTAIATVGAALARWPVGHGHSRTRTEHAERLLAIFNHLLLNLEQLECRREIMTDALVAEQAEEIESLRRRLQAAEDKITAAQSVLAY